jgi:UDPglucose 6-dehydrogenase
MKIKIILVIIVASHINCLNSISQDQLINDAKKIAIIGTGYVGIVTGAGLAEFGNSVVCADIEKKKIEMLQRGEIPIYEPGLKEIVDKNVTDLRLTFTTDVAQAIKQADVIFIAVGTPMQEDGSADLSYVLNVVNTIAQNINGFKIICTKSTVPIGTGAWIRNLLEDQGINPSSFVIVSNPEFLREGSAVSDFIHPDRIVIGAESEIALKIMQNIYGSLFKLGVKHVLTNVTTSETIKYASNAFLAVKLSYINEIANLCDANGADIKTVAYAMGLDKRISPLFLQPGPGFGGSCFPKDSQALLYMAQQKSLPLPVVQASLITNEMQKKIPAQKLLKLFNYDINGKTIAILGLAFKANTDDVRSSPAISTIKELQKNGAYIKAYDPVAMENMHLQLPNIEYCSTLENAITHADALVIMTEWDEFKFMDLEKVGALMQSKILVDARNIINIDELKRLGFIFDNIGQSYLRN